MEETEELDIEIEDIGTILKSNRLKSKKTLEDISSELCIRKMYLIALEEGDYETLEPIPYGVGYMRTYAKYLGLNPERAVKLYKAASQIEELPKKEEENSSEIDKSSVWHILSGVVIVILIYMAWNFYTKTKTEPQIFPEIIENEDTLDTSSVVIEPNLDNENRQSLDIENNLEEKTEVQPETVKEPEEIVNTKINFEFLGETWVELKDKNKVYFQGVYHKGDVKEVEYTDNLFISVGRPQNVKITVKGQEKNILKKKRKMNIPLDSLE